MKDSGSETVTVPPPIQRLERRQTFEKEHKDALERAVSLNIPYAVDATEDEQPESQEGEPSNSENKDTSSTKSASGGGRLDWDNAVEKLYKNESGDLHSKSDIDFPK